MTDLQKLLKYINDYSEEQDKCPSQTEIITHLNWSYKKVIRLIRSIYVVGMIKPKKALNRKGSKRTDRNWQVTEAGKEFLKTATMQS